MDVILDLAKTVLGTATDVLPVALFLFFFHAVVLKRKLVNRNRIIVGFCLVVLGLGLFLVGLERGLFPLGRLMAEQLTSLSMQQATGTSVDWSDYYWVYIFAFAVGFGTTFAEPALLAVAIKANAVSGGAVHIWGLRIAVAIGVAVGVSLGCFRIVTGTPLHWYIIVCYLFVVAQTAFSPKLLVPLAYDTGGVTTSTVTVPLVAALGLGLAENVPGRSPLLDGFGLIAFASLFPIMSVLAYAQMSAYMEHRGSRQKSGSKTKDSKEVRKED